MESVPLQPVLRLIHCLQKERGASCALVGSLAQPDCNGIDDSSDDGPPPGMDGEEEEHSYEGTLRAARVSVNAALTSFYGSAIWRIYRSGAGEDLEVTAKLFRARQLVDGGAGDANRYLFFHGENCFCAFSLLSHGYIRMWCM